MLEEISFESWYLYLIICGVLYFCTNYLYIQYLNKKLGAKLPGSCKSDGCFGFRSGFEMLKAKKIGRQVDLLHERFNDLSNPEVNDTFTSYNFGFPMIITKDPENIKALLATQFNDFSLGRRYDFFKPLLGKGIFTLDGEGWKHSRSMLRPQFAREQIAHVKALEPHFQLLKKHITKNKGQFSIFKNYFSGSRLILLLNFCLVNLCHH